MEYYSQIGQDKFIDEYFESKENGIFVDIGAHDGKSCSNSLFFERFRNWSGICVEPGPEEFKKLSETRRSININACVSSYDGESDFTYIVGAPNMLSGLSEGYNQAHINRIRYELQSYGGSVTQIKMPVYRLQTILDAHSISSIDYCSIDTEGTEMDILKSIDFERTSIKAFSIENNYNDSSIKEFLEERGYVLYKKLDWDDIFIKLPS
jgi:FkbM family methyltransferase